MKKVCLDCKPGKNCMVHHKYDTGDYVVLPPDRRAKRIVELEQENKALLEALWYCGKSKELDTVEAGIRAIIPKELAKRIDFERLKGED